MHQLEQIQQIKQRPVQTMLTSHVDEIDALLSDVKQFISPEGQLVGKADELAAHREGTLHIKRMIPPEPMIELISDVALVFVSMN